MTPLSIIFLLDTLPNARLGGGCSALLLRLSWIPNMHALGPRGESLALLLLGTALVLGSVLLRRARSAAGRNLAARGPTAQTGDPSSARVAAGSLSGTVRQ